MDASPELEELTRRLVNTSSPRRLLTQRSDLQKIDNVSFTDASPSQGSPTGKLEGEFKRIMDADKQERVFSALHELRQLQPHVLYVTFTGDRQLVARVNSSNGDLLAIYQGDLQDDLPNGTGLLKFSKDEYYQGSWRRGLAQGEGTLAAKDYTYKGHFTEGIFNGQGILNIKDKGTYEGSFVDGQCNGRGKFTWAGGKKIYVGMWKNNQFHGRGLMVWSDGRKYFGDYQNGLKHGKGLCVFADGTSIKGQWTRGQFTQPRESSKQ